jgi:hypothetical protein
MAERAEAVRYRSIPLLQLFQIGGKYSRVANKKFTEMPMELDKIFSGRVFFFFQFMF